MLDKTKERLADYIADEVRASLIRIGIKRFSKLYKSVTVVMTDEGFSIYMNEYFENVEKGRKRHSKRVPISAIQDWVKRYLIPLDARTVVERIYQNGIKPRPFSEKALSNINRDMDKILNEWLADAIV